MNIAQLFNSEDRTQLEKWCRAHVQQAYLGNSSALCRVLGKYLMYVDTRDESLAPHLMMNGFWEMWVTMAIARYVKPGMRCVDVGANFGYYTLLMADLVGAQGSVVAYEPQPALQMAIHSSLEINGFGAHRVMCSAVGAEAAELPLFTSTHDRGAGSLVQKVGLHLDECGRARVIALDDELGPAVDFVKIDVQGYEMQVLRGMKKIIAHSTKIAIAMEFTPGEHAQPHEALCEIQEDMGLRIRTIGTDGEVRPLSADQAASPDTGDHRMLWLTRADQ